MSYLMLKQKNKKSLKQMRIELGSILQLLHKINRL